MGVPSFFAWLLKKYGYDQLMMTNTKKRARCLYLDSNCLFHPQCFKLLKYYPDETNIEKLESRMIQRIINYIKYLVRLIDPSEFLYISVDGVAPIAKIGQQRKRRYRGVDDNILKNNIMRKHKIPHNEKWSNIVITPGTDFMDRLDASIIEYCKTIKHIKVIYSSYHVPGEGEHKILQHIKTLESTDDPIIVYGLDADLIFLSLASGKDNIFLLRESAQLGMKRIEEELYDPIKDVAEELMFVPIDIMKKLYNVEFREMIKNADSTLNVNDVDFINDFIFLCFLLGNDFLPHFPSIEIRCGGIEYIFDAYIQMYITYKTPITSMVDKKIEINTEQIMMVLKWLGDKETEYFKHVMPEFAAKIEKKRCFASDAYSKELWELENLRNIKVDDPIMLGYDNSIMWKFRYYEHHFGTFEHQLETINEVCKNYIDGLIWVSKYYFEECKSWRWQYKYLHAPFISDVAEYLKYSKTDLSSINHNVTLPINMHDQLLAVIPPHHIDIIPRQLRKFMNSPSSPIIHMFPLSVQLDTLYKDQLWQCIPLVPYLDIDSIEKCTKTIQLDKDDILKLKCVNVNKEYNV
jgi:5'-3' exoribonuclease 1